MRKALQHCNDGRNLSIDDYIFSVAVAWKPKKSKMVMPSIFSNKMLRSGPSSVYDKYLFSTASIFAFMQGCSPAVAATSGSVSFQQQGLSGLRTSCCSGHPPVNSASISFSTAPSCPSRCFLGHCKRVVFVRSTHRGLQLKSLLNSEELH